MIVALAGLALAACELSFVPPAGSRDPLVAFDTGWLPVGSLVRAEGRCHDQRVAVEVISVVPTYRQLGRPVVTVGARGCLAADRVQPVGTTRYVVLRPRPEDDRPELLPPGTLLPAIADAGSCDDRYHFGGFTAPTVALGTTRPIPDRMLVVLRQLQRELEPYLGTVPLHALPFTDWERVGLPLVRDVGPEELARTWAAEGLDTEERREKAIVAYGPEVDGVPAWLHFLGTDAPGSDAWAQPETVVQLARLARRWRDRCVEVLRRGPSCVLQLGDLGWYSGRLPDPLGHADHFEGTCVDIRLFRTDASRYEAWWNKPDDRTGERAYDRELTAAFLELARDELAPVKLFFNDPDVIGSVPGVHFWRGHDDHMHLCVPVSELGRG